jgi:hypothetical protein
MLTSRKNKTQILLIDKVNGKAFNGITINEFLTYKGSDKFSLMVNTKYYVANIDYICDIIK